MPDLVIVGGGVVGATAACQAARRGASVLLVDAREPGRATDAGAVWGLVKKTLATHKVPVGDDPKPAD